MISKFCFCLVFYLNGIEIRKNRQDSESISRIGIGIVKNKMMPNPITTSGCKLCKSSASVGTAMSLIGGFCFRVICSVNSSIKLD